MRAPTCTSTGSGTPVPRPYRPPPFSTDLLNAPPPPRLRRPSSSSRRPVATVPARFAAAKLLRGGGFPAQFGEIGLVERFPLEEAAGAAFEHVALRPQQVDGAAERLVDNTLNGAVDFARGFLAVTALGVRHLRRLG